jgi:hypothetical protein
VTRGHGAVDPLSEPIDLAAGFREDGGGLSDAREKSRQEFPDTL